MTGWLRRRAPGGTAGPRRLSSLRAGETATIARIDAPEASRLVKLSSLGLMPGARVRLVQTSPAVVLQVAETTIALDPEVAAHIVVEPA